jgi:acetyl-CoA C-acetyltransferase
MIEAYLIGAGQSDFGSFPGESYRSLFDAAFDEAADSIDADFDTERIDETFLGTLGVGGRQLGLSGPAVTEHLGLHGLPTTRVENACAASGYALRNAVTAVRAGMADVALAGGYEVMTDMSGNALCGTRTENGTEVVLEVVEIISQYYDIIEITKNAGDVFKEIDG